MSLDRTIKIEPFIKIPIQYKEVEVKIKTCGEHQTKTSDSFCAKCGKAFFIETKTEKRTKWAWELIGQDDVFLDCEQDGYMLLYSNFNMKTKIDTNENVFSELTDFLISEMIKEFKEVHSEHIRRLEESINLKVDIVFGFIYIVE